jgi:hypothetical protein
MDLRRDVRPDASVLLSDGACEFEYRRPRAGLVVVRISGIDKGHLGQGPMHELNDDLRLNAPLDVFVDARDARMPAVAAQEAWTAWFKRHRGALAGVHMLVTGKYMHFTVEVVKLLSHTGELIRIYLDAELFEAALARARATRR